MYQSHFHLHDRPFSSAANPEHYFPASSIEQSRECIARNVERASCVTIVTGPVGSGKTLLCQLIANQYAGELPVCLVQGESLNSSAVLLQSILHRLGLPFRGQDEGELRLVLSDHISSPGCVKGILLIIDDADRLSTELLDEVRAITNIVKEGQPCARVLLAGSPRLDENIAHPDLESLNQRIVGRLYLDNFSYQETGDYVQARIAACGGDAASLFTPDSLETVHRATNGVPRLVNQICDHALMLGSINSADQLTARLIEEAWADLQQLPLPSASYTNEVEVESSASEGDSVIEFGLLDETSEANELVEIEQTLADLGYEASRAARPIAVGGEIEFEGGHHDVKASYSSSVLPLRPETNDESEGVSDDELPGENAKEVSFESENSESSDAESTQTFSFESTDEDREPTILFESESESDAATDSTDGGNSSVTLGAEPVDGTESVTESSVVEFAFDVNDDFDETEPAESLDAFALPGNAEASEESESNTDESELDAIFEMGSDSSVSELDESHGLRVHGLDENEPLERESEYASYEENTTDDGEASTYREFEVSVGEEPTEHEIDEANEHAIDQGEQALDSFAPTMDQAANPFGDGFSDEEVVVQHFASPSRLARESYDPVTTAYSQQLSLQLAAAHPGLRMHPASPIEIVDVEDPEEFRPLSACLDNDAFVGDEEVAFAPADDPIMPEPSVHGLHADSNISGGSEATRTESVIAAEPEVAEAQATEDEASLWKEEDGDADNQGAVEADGEAAEVAHEFSLYEGAEDETDDSPSFVDNAFEEEQEEQDFDSSNSEVDLGQVAMSPETVPDADFEATVDADFSSTDEAGVDVSDEEDADAPVVATIGVQATPRATKPKPKRRFRTLFSSMRGKGLQNSKTSGE